MARFPRPGKISEPGLLRWGVETMTDFFLSGTPTLGTELQIRGEGQ